MEIDFTNLYNKLLKFWREHDGVEFTNESLREVFSAAELACIMFDNGFDNINYTLIRAFGAKLHKIKDLITPTEADALYPNYGEDTYLMSFCSDEFLLSLIDDEEFNRTQDAIHYMDSDEVLIEAFKRLKDPYLKGCALYRVKDTDLKLKYMKKLPPSEKNRVLMSIKDEFLIEKFITLFNGSKGELISWLDDDEKKERYFKKFFAVLSKEERANIIISFKDDEKVLYYLRFVGDYAKGEAVYRFKDKPEIQDRLLGSIRNKRVLADALQYREVDDQLVAKYMDRITNEEDLEMIIFDLEDDQLMLKYFSRLSYKRKLEKVQEYGHPVMRFKLLKAITKPKDVISIIEHTERFPEYIDEYEYIIDIYANQYKIDKGRLLTAVKNVSFSILKYIENENIQKILNAKEDEFVLLMRIFNKNDLKMDQSSMNDILNAMLQRQFRLNAPEVVMIFPLILGAVDRKDRVAVLEKINVLNSVVNVNDEIAEYGWNVDSFVDALLDKDEAAIDFLHILTAKYIRSERSIYVQEQLGNAQVKSTIAYCDKNDLVRYVINTFPVEYIMTFFSFSERDLKRKEVSEELYEFSQNKELIEKIIRYKKNPRSFDRIPDDVRSNMRMFNAIIEKAFSYIRVVDYPEFNGKKTLEFKVVDEEFLASILMYVDIDKLRKHLFNNPDLIEKFMKFWKQYKIGGWGNTFDYVLNSAGVVVDAEIVANFLQYFGISYEQLEEKKEKKEIPSISITALLDMAACYSTESKKYALLFGNEDFRLLASNPGRNASTLAKDKRMARAVELLHTIRNRDYVAVPPVDKDFELSNGKKMNVVVGNFSNMMNLTYGERTDACMRIGGAGNTLFEYCLGGENGFHIRFVNPKTGKFVSRVSGFRNGNTVFLNELRFSEDSAFTNQDVVEACRAVARELIEQSKDSELPIDNVVVSPHYAMKQSGMHAKNLGISNPQQGMKRFYTDVTSCSIVLATSHPKNELVTPKLGVKGVPKYPVLRDKKRILYNMEAANYAAHIDTLDQVLDGISVDDTNAVVNEDIAVCLAGEDWYVTINKQGNINRFIMKNSNNKNAAINEVQEALAYIRENLDKELQMANNVLGM